MPWIPRGLREGIVTSRYPRRADGYGDSFRGTMVVNPGSDGDRRVALAAQACPTEAISIENGQPRLDRGRCILCGSCAVLYPQRFHFDPSFETSALRREALIVPDDHPDDQALEQTKAALAQRVKALRRSVHIRHVDAGSDGADEWEVAALTNPVYDVQRLGIFFTASPRHADLLLATGVGTAGMHDPLRETYEAMPEPKVVIAAGTDAISGGLIGGTYVAKGGLSDVLPVDVFVPGSPPSPFGLLQGILLAIGLLPEGATRHRRPSKNGPRVGTEQAASGLASPVDPLQEAGP
jgi:Ni,Fe-hydrogenase III small subunit/ferredoxin